MLENVSVEKKANFYFDGKVTSRNVLFADGSKKPSELCFLVNMNLIPARKN